MTRRALFVVALICLLVGGSSGQLSRRYFEAYPDYDASKYEIDESYDDDISNDLLPKVKSSTLRKFMDALVMEAGRHVLYPPKETSRNRGSGEQYDLSPSRNKGQPEYINLAMKREPMTSRPCPEECPMFHPVCGNDGKAYNSECHLLKANCGLRNVTTGDWELCRGKHFLCPRKCLDINDPVCGHDGRMYHNICVMRKRNCGRFIETRPIKFCYSRESKPSKDCPDDCQEIYKPVCGTDGVLYYNECFLKMRTCGDNVDPAPLDTCAQPSECPERCVAIYDPVCGSDGKVYTNLCRMLQENCGNEIKRMKWSFCERRQI